MASHASGPSAYAGGGMAFGDDDPFADDVPHGALELDLPSSHTANTPRSIPGAPPAPGSVPDLALPPPSSPRLAPASGAPESSPSLSPESPPSLPGAPPSPPAPAGARVAAHVPAAPPPDPAALIARFPPPPAKVWETPGYAVKVLWRQLELRQDLASLRRRRSPDVALYERALTTYDSKTFAVGLAITCAGLAIASFVFFLPVILRFLRAD